MSASRFSLYAVGVPVAANLILFILGAEFLFLGPVHHHWVFPYEALIFGAQYVVFSRLGIGPSRSTSLALLSLLGVATIARWETIHTCSSHCVPKVGLALVLAGCALVLGQRYEKHRGSLGMPALGAAVILAGALFIYR